MTSEPTIVGIDLGKNWFHLIGLDARGAIVLRRKMNRLQLAEYAATAPRCVVAMESCPGSQYWGRVFTKAGHEVRILPAQFVKPYLKANKNDFNDAEAIAEAGGRAHMRCVPLKTNEQLELQALHRVRRRFIIERTAGYPYFLQEWGKHAWDTADDSPITSHDVAQASEVALAALDASFFRVRFD